MADTATYQLPEPEVTKRMRKVAREDWPVLIQDAHPGYIPWEEFERNQVTLRQNTPAFSPGGRGRMPREGPALLQGRVVCGRCGAGCGSGIRELAASLAPYYVCTEEVGTPRRHDRASRSADADIDVRRQRSCYWRPWRPPHSRWRSPCRTRSPGGSKKPTQLRRSQLERARYEAELARRRYLKVDPDNRLVADTLEADWNEQLRNLDALQQEHERQRKADEGLLER